MDRIQGRQEAATRVQARVRALLAVRRVARMQQAATVIQRRFREHKEVAAAAKALELARLRRRIRKHEIESKYLRNLPTDKFEEYHHKKRDHAATVIQKCWRRQAKRTERRLRMTQEGGGREAGAAATQWGTPRREKREDAPAAPSPSGRAAPPKTPPLSAEPSFASALSLDYDDHENDSDLEDLLELEGGGGAYQSNAREYWDLLPSEKKSRILSEVRRRAETMSEYGKVYSRGDADKARASLQVGSLFSTTLLPHSHSLTLPSFSVRDVTCPRV